MNTPRWLTDEEQRIWRSFSEAVGMLRGSVEGQLQRDSRMPYTYYEVLVALSEAPGRTLRMSELAEVSRSSRSRLSHAVSRLEAAGWVRRSSCATDKRGAWAELTDEGFAALAEAAPGHVEEVRRALFDPLSPEQVRQLEEISLAITAALRGPCSAAIAAEQAAETEEHCPSGLEPAGPLEVSGEPRVGSSGVSG